VIGITAYAEPSVRWGAWDVPAAVIPLAYVTMIESAGGRALLVPPSEEGIEETLDAVDGVLFSGGSDIEPTEYGHEAHPETSGTRPERDRGELALLRAALERDMPVLAVCRGSQVLNVARGGDLVQHLPDVVGDEKLKHTPGVFADHEVQVREETRLGSLLGARAAVKSHHHQGFGTLGDGLVESAWADDGTLEALEDPSKRFAVGVLWHPEEGEDAALFRALVEEARAYREAKG
jgi:gamma-glutamyl-gamma-aminobutyrate hydrolase PuuD